MKGTATQWIRDRLRAGEISPKSARLYTAAVRSFTEYAGPITPDRVTEERVRDWLAAIEMLAPASRAKYLQIIRAFFAWCQEEGIVLKNPARRIRGPRIPDRRPRTLIEEQIQALYQECESPRDRLIVSLGVNEGLRSIEISRLHTSDLDPLGDLHVYGKGDKERLVPIGPDSQALWDELRAADPRPGPIIRHAQAAAPRPLSERTVQTVVTEALRRAQVKLSARDGMGIHALRRTMATRALEGGADVFDLMELLGHAELSTVRRYARPPRERLVAITAKSRFQEAS